MFISHEFTGLDIYKYTRTSKREIFPVHAMKAYGAVEVYLRLLLASALDGGNVQLRTPSKEPRVTVEQETILF